MQRGRAVAEFDEEMARDNESGELDGKRTRLDRCTTTLRRARTDVRDGDAKGFAARERDVRRGAGPVLKRQLRFGIRIHASDCH